MKREALLLLTIVLASACGSTQSYQSQLEKKSENSSIESPEGWVRLSFDITESGTTENIKVLDASPSSIFNSEAIKTLSRWKYKPKVVDGVAVKQTGLKVQLDFKLEGNEN